MTTYEKEFLAIFSSKYAGADIEIKSVYGFGYKLVQQ